MAAKNEGGYQVTGFPPKAGNALMKASSKVRPPKVPKASKIPSPKVPKVRGAKSPAKLY